MLIENPLLSKLKTTFSLEDVVFFMVFLAFITGLLQKEMCASFEACKSLKTNFTIR